VGVNAVATKGMLGDLNPLGDGPCCGPYTNPCTHKAPRRQIEPFLALFVIEGVPREM